MMTGEIHTYMRYICELDREKGHVCVAVCFPSFPPGGSDENDLIEHILITEIAQSSSFGLLVRGFAFTKKSKNSNRLNIHIYIKREKQRNKEELLFELLLNALTLTTLIILYLGTMVQVS